MSFIDMFTEIHLTLLIIEDLFMQIGSRERKVLERRTWDRGLTPVENITRVSELPWDFAREYFQIREYAKSSKYWGILVGGRERAAARL